MAIQKFRVLAGAAGLVSLLLTALPAAGEPQDTVTTSYSYDALGRLVTTRETCPGQQVETSIEYDRAGNRKQLATIGAPGCGRAGFVVVPLNGFTIIPLG